MRQHQPLSSRQQLALSFIHAEIAAGRPFPDERKLATHMGWKHPGSARDCLFGLRYRGLITGVKRSSRETGSHRVVIDWDLPERAMA